MKFDMRDKDPIAIATFKDWMQVKYFYIPFPIAVELSIFGLLALVLFG